MKQPQRGYSLVEMLVVVAIVGIFSLIAVPQFVSYYRQSQIRGSVRNFNSYVRAARQKAITENRPVGINIENVPGVAPNPPRGRFRVMVGTVDTSTSPPTTTWAQTGRELFLEETVQFGDSDMTFNGADGVWFQPNGSLGNMPTSPSTPTIIVYSNANVPNNRCTLTFSTAGSFTQALSTVP